MNSSAAIGSQSRKSRWERPAPVIRRISLLMLWLALAALVIWGARTDWYNVDSALAYWLGVVGGSAMLALLLYPLRKRLPASLSVGRLRYWFSAHMMLGIAGPVLILLHCKLSLGSLNAKVAFWSMVVVASSGIVGRFLYAQLHSGLYGRQRNASELRVAAAQALSVAGSLVGSTAGAQAALNQFSEHAAGVARRGLAAPWQQLTLALRARAVRRACLAQLKLADRAAHRNHDIEVPLRRYLEAACAAARFGALERLFSLWHVAHLPLVAILLLTAVFHVLAVHMY